MLQLRQSYFSCSQFGLPPIDLARPQSLAELSEIWDYPSAAPCYLAGGTDLFIQFREGLRPELIVDINEIEQLVEINKTAEHLTIGSGVRHNDGICHPSVKGSLPGMDIAWALIGNVRIRGMGTLGGNLMARRPRYEGPILAAALNAELNFLNPSGTSLAMIEDVWDGNITPGALLISINIPLYGSPRLAYDRSLRPTMTIAVVIEESENGGFSGRAVVGSEWDQPVLLPLDLRGSKNLREVVSSAREISRTAFLNLPETVADAGYKRDAGASLLTRLLVQLGES